MKNVKSPFIYLVWSVPRLSGFVSLCFPEGSGGRSFSSFSSQTPQQFCRVSIFCSITDWGFSFVLLLLLLSFQEVKIFLAVLWTLSERCYFWPHVYSLGRRSRCCSSWCMSVSIAFATGQERSSHDFYQAGPNIYSNIFVYPVPSLLQRSLLRILALKHVTKSALHSRVHYLSRACVIAHFPSQFRSDPLTMVQRMSL